MTIMEDMAAGLAVESVKAITKVVIGRAASETISLSWGSPKKLQQKFIYIEAFLDDMGSAKNGKLVNVWVQKLKEVAYDADRLMDDYAYERLRKKHELKAFKDRFRNYLTPSSSTNHVVLSLKMTIRFNRIMSELNELLNEYAKLFGLKPAELAQRAVQSAAAASASGDNHAADKLYEARKHADASGSDFIGREKDVDDLLESILNPTPKKSGLFFLGIVGLGGLGKTTLARRLFKHEKVAGFFENKKVWICVSKNFNIEKLLEEIIESLTRTKCDLINTDANIEKHAELLKGKKFFVVLDDVWEDDKRLWDSLKNKLQGIGGISGSVILITTRKNGVAKKACDKIHTLHGLSIDEGLTLLKQQVSDEKLNSFSDVGRRIVEKCQGVPLAIKSIGGLLKLKQFESEWKSIEESELWSNEPDDDNYLMPSLLLSYNDINHVHAKQCFAYCAIFPKDSQLQKSQLIAMWLAQGLLHEESETIDSIVKAEMVGEQYINILVNYSLLEEEDGGDETAYKMHDLVHDLAAYVSRENLFVWKARDKPKDADSHLQHLAFDLGKNEIELESHTEKKMMRKLRTISFWDRVPRWKILDCARYIRTLVMVDARLTEVSSGIGQLVHLRYLDLSENDDIKALPDSVCKLYQLQALRLLRCYDLKELPKGLDRLENLRHIWTSGYLVAPRGLRQLRSLQTLPVLELRGGEGWTIDELGPLDQVKGELYIRGLEHVKNNEEARKAGLGSKEVLRLDMSWGDDRHGKAINDEEVLDGLQPHPIIEILKVTGFEGERFPKWLMTMNVGPSGNSTTQLSHLKELTLKDCNKCQQLPSLGQLPHLTILKLDGFDEVESIRDEFYVNNNNVAGSTEDLFPSLRELRIEKFRKLTTWTAPSTTTILSRRIFPMLEELLVRRCPSLGIIEEGVLQGLSSLRELTIEDCLKCQQLPSLGQLPHLTILDLDGFDEVESITDEFYVNNNNVAGSTQDLFPSLRELRIEKFEKLTMWTAPSTTTVLSRRIFPMLEELEVRDCPSLGIIEEGVLQGLSSLRQLDIYNCRGLKRIPRSLEDCTSLERLLIASCPLIGEGEGEDAFPDISKLPNLTGLSLWEVGRLTASLLGWIPQLHLLFELRLEGCGEEEWDMSLTSSLPSLRSLSLEKFRNMKEVVVANKPDQPIQHLLPPSLEELRIEGFEEMEALPDCIAYLSSLRRLTLCDCKKLKYLPSKHHMSRLSQLIDLDIRRCPELEERCDKHNGPEWPNISHIPTITINFRYVQHLRE